MRCRADRRGVYTIEWALLMAAVVIVATVLMRDYVRQAIEAGRTGSVAQVQHAMTDNRP